MNDKRSQFNVMNDTVNDRKGHNIEKDSFAHKPGGLFVYAPHQMLQVNWFVLWESI